MNDWVASLNEFLIFRRRNILEGHGKVTNTKMERFALEEYAKFNTRRLKAPEQNDADDFVIDDLNDVAKRPK
jgi:hypothetical protein